MTFEVKIDPEDFAVDIVIAIPKKRCASFGCPLPSASGGINDRDEIIFRQIRSSVLRGGFVTIQTRFIPGAKVVPTVTLDIRQLVTSNGTQATSNRQVVKGSRNMLDAVSRVDTVGFNDVKREASFNVNNGIMVNVEATFSGRVCEFKFERFPPQVTFVQTLSADLLATLTVDANFSNRQSGLLFKQGIPELGFSEDFSLIGRVSIGIIVALEYETELDINADLSASFSASYRTSSKVSLGEVNKAERTEDSVGDRAADLNLKFQLDSANFTVSRFLGLRPEVEAEVELPLIGEGGIRLAGTVALEAKVGYEKPPFAPIADGNGTCAACHEVGGSLDLVGRRLSVTALIPIANDREFIIANEFFDVPIAKVCYYAVSCPGTIEDEREQYIAPLDIPETLGNDQPSAENQEELLNDLFEQANGQGTGGNIQQAVEDSIQTNAENQGEIANELMEQANEQAGDALSAAGQNGNGSQNVDGSRVASVSNENNTPPVDSSGNVDEEDEDGTSGSGSNDKSGDEDSDSGSESDSDEN